MNMNHNFIENRINDTEIKVAKLEEVYKIRLAMFVFKNKWYFQLHNTGFQTEARASTVAAHVPWKKEHSRMQAGCQGYLVFNELPSEFRQERRLSTFKRLVKEFFVSYGIRKGFEIAMLLLPLLSLLWLLLLYCAVILFNYCCCSNQFSSYHCSFSSLFIIVYSYKCCYHLLIY